MYNLQLIKHVINKKLNKKSEDYQNFKQRDGSLPRKEVHKMAQKYLMSLSRSETRVAFQHRRIFLLVLDVRKLCITMYVYHTNLKTKPWFSLGKSCLFWGVWLRNMNINWLGCNKLYLIVLLLTLWKEERLCSGTPSSWYLWKSGRDLL